MSPRKHDSRRDPPTQDKDPAADATSQGEPAPEAAQEEDTAAQSGWASGETAAELDALRTENAELKDRVLRTMAEMENLRRRTERDKADTAKYAISSFARDVLNVGDNIARAIAAVPEGAADADPALKALIEGVEVTERELQTLLERHGIRKLDPQGERFDPNLHQAMLEMEDAGVPSGTVLQVLQPGYVIQDRVLRPALVAVSKGGERPPKADTGSGDGDDSAATSKAQPDADGTTGKSGTRYADSLGARIDRSA